MTTNLPTNDFIAQLTDFTGGYGGTMPTYVQPTLRHITPDDAMISCLHQLQQQQYNLQLQQQQLLSVFLQRDQQPKQTWPGHACSLPNYHMPQMTHHYTAQGSPKDMHRQKMSQIYHDAGRRMAASDGLPCSFQPSQVQQPTKNRIARSGNPPPEFFKRLEHTLSMLGDSNNSTNRLAADLSNKDVPASRKRKRVNTKDITKPNAPTKRLYTAQISQMSSKCDETISTGTMRNFIPSNPAVPRQVLPDSNHTPWESSSAVIPSHEIASKIGFVSTDVYDHGIIDLSGRNSQSERAEGSDVKHDSNNRCVDSDNNIDFETSAGSECDNHIETESDSDNDSDNENDDDSGSDIVRDENKKDNSISMDADDTSSTGDRSEDDEKETSDHDGAVNHPLGPYGTGILTFRAPKGKLYERQIDVNTAYDVFYQYGFPDLVDIADHVRDMEAVLNGDWPTMDKAHYIMCLMYDCEIDYFTRRYIHPKWFPKIYEAATLHEAFENTFAGLVEFIYNFDGDIADILAAHKTGARQLQNDDPDSLAAVLHTAFNTKEPEASQPACELNSRKRKRDEYSSDERDFSSMPKKTRWSLNELDLFTGEGCDWSA